MYLQPWHRLSGNYVVRGFKLMNCCGQYKHSESQSKCSACSPQGCKFGLSGLFSFYPFFLFHHFFSFYKTASWLTKYPFCWCLWTYFVKHHVEHQVLFGVLKLLHNYATQNHKEQKVKLSRSSLWYHTQGYGMTTWDMASSLWNWPHREVERCLFKLKILGRNANC